jgi:hypothetical protein
MNHEESKLQQECVAEFRAEHPEYAMLLTHPINEGSKNTRVTGAIHKAEGTVAGVPDLLFFLPSFIVDEKTGEWIEVHGLGIEFKTPKGKQSEEQKKFQRYFESAGYAYRIVRTKEQFRELIMVYIFMAKEILKDKIHEEHQRIEKESAKKEREHFYKVIGKKSHG